MAQNLLACDRDQQMLLPHDMRDWLSQDHLAWFVLDAVEELDLTGFYASYRDDGQGAPAHDPKMMVGLLLYAYAVGETSTRSIERRLREDVAFRVIAANQAPDHTTVSRFRSRHQEALADLFAQILMLCQRAGIVCGKTLAVDGTKLQANASLDANRTHDEIRAEVERYLEEAEEVDRKEDELYGGSRGDELPEHLARPDSRKEALRRAKAELDREEQEREAAHAEKLRRHQAHIEKTGRRPPGRPPGKKPWGSVYRGALKRNFTDPESRVVRDKGAYIQGYNAQAIVTEGQVIVACDLADDANDTRQLEPMSSQASRQLEDLGEDAESPTVLADAGYWNSTHIKNLRLDGIQAIVPTVSIPPYKKNPHKPRPRRGPEAERMDRLLATDEGRALSDKRKYMVEPVFGQIKHTRGLKRLSRRGAAACRAEWKLIAATHNLLKLRTAFAPG